jgi:metal-responsive CopG/Arc/MetJ family transcriptional regulator
MKIAVSIPDKVFHEADSFAKRHRVSRSALFAEAVKSYVAQNRPEDVTQRLDAVYGKKRHDLDGLLTKMQTASIPREKW